MTRVGGDSAELDAVAGVMSPGSTSHNVSSPSNQAHSSTKGMVLVTAISSLNTTPVHYNNSGTGHPFAVAAPVHNNFIQSRQQMSKMSPCALQMRLQSTLWQMTLMFDNEEDCAAAARHIEIRR